MTPPNGAFRVASTERKTACPVPWATKTPEPPSRTRISGFPRELKERTDYTGATRRMRRNKEDDGRRNGNSVVSTEAADQERKERNGDTRTVRHAPGGTWLTKIRSFLKDSIIINQESYGRRGGAVQEEGGERLGGNREETRRSKERGYKL
ncbi:hypothetical protein NDU88_004400 [Pleurodeles waltl]|uniref:Uncharacterized protein n=1 Tax=Pleurodeles waltl TaxID=8319 RepID=A0AAV7VIK1_PLEWA|nr:hypothetical protein NDU88_004400 [Pleurodeles waltl]